MTRLNTQGQIRMILMGILCALVTFRITRAASVDNPQSQWVHPGSNGKLVYKTLATGDKIMDFSFAGYRGGGVALPQVPIIKTLAPSNKGNDTPAIQAAINEIATMPLKDGFRGALLLKPGTFTCFQTIKISAGGVVLRGSGSGAPGNGESAAKSTIKMIGDPHLAITISSSQNSTSQPETDTTKGKHGIPVTTIADVYVPSGAISFSVADAKALAAGDSIIIEHPITPAWIKFMQMDDLQRSGRPLTWIPSDDTITTLRTITRISGNTITIDAPLSDCLDAKYLNPPGTAIYKAKTTDLISQSGIENLHIECPPQGATITQKLFQAFRINGQDCWARDVVCDETMNSVGVSGRRITLLRVAVNRKVEQKNPARPAEFSPNGTQVLLDHCSAMADNVWFSATGARVAGPVVLLNCVFRGKSDAESHARWSTGLLYDNCRVPDGAITLRNRGAMGTGHGWSMGWGVVWNCQAQEYIVQNPPGAMNWLIGSIGHDVLAPRPFDTNPNLPEGTVDSKGVPVVPKSLYLAQLDERLGPQALKNIGY